MSTFPFWMLGMPPVSGNWDWHPLRLPEAPSELDLACATASYWTQSLTLEALGLPLPGMTGKRGANRRM